MKGDRERCLAGGMDDYVSKPVQIAELRRALGATAGTASARDPMPDAEDCFKAACDLQAALEQVGGDEELLDEVISVFRQNAPRLLGNVRDAVNEGDAGRLQIAAHALKGSVGYLSARPTLEAAQRLETIGNEGDLAEAHYAYGDRELEFNRLSAVLAASANHKEASTVGSQAN